jgi:hypothetical protein
MTYVKMNADRNIPILYIIKRNVSRKVACLSRKKRINRVTGIDNRVTGIDNRGREKKKNRFLKRFHVVTYM